MDEPHSPRVLDSLALAYYLSGEPGKAAGVLRKAIAALGEDREGMREALERKLAKYLAEAEEGGFEVEDGV
jgi:hypothetical protein